MNHEGSPIVFSAMESPVSAAAAHPAHSFLTARRFFASTGSNDGPPPVVAEIMRPRDYRPSRQKPNLEGASETVKKPKVLREAL